MAKKSTPWPKPTHLQRAKWAHQEYRATLADIREDAKFFRAALLALAAHFPVIDGDEWWQDLMNAADTLREARPIPLAHIREAQAAEGRDTDPPPGVG